MPITETQARENLKRLLADFDQLSAEDRKTMSEASVVRQFIDRLLAEVLDWPIKDPQRYKYEMHTQAGRPDLTLFPEKGGVIFVEAKRFGIIKQLEEARYTVSGVITPGQMALPGMATDRTPEEQQAINYAFANGGTWAILTNFEKLRLFNAKRDWLVLSFEEPTAYLREFDQLWQLAYQNVLNGSLDALSNQRYARDIDSTYLDFINEWRLKLAQDIAKRKSVNRWAVNTDGSLKLTELRAVVQRFLDRLVIARFAEDWLVIPAGTVRDFYELRQRNPYSFTLDKQLDQFFRQFDVRHNSALFAYGLVDRANFSDGVLLPLLDKLYEVRYRAMPADILGNTYEQFLGKTLALQNGSVETRDNLETRKKQGSYYTPQVIVQYIVDNSLGRYLYGTANGKPDGDPLPDERRKTSTDIRELRVLDSACGSGSFLIYAFKVLAEFYEGETKRLEREGEAKRLELAKQGMTSPLELQIQLTPYTSEIERIRNYPRLILETHIYGVDLDPAAAEIATVNLMMRAMENRNQEKRLPLILNQSIKVGNGLVGMKADDPRMSQYQTTLAELIAKRHELTTDPDKGKPSLEVDTDLSSGMTLEEALLIPNLKERERLMNLIIQRQDNEDTTPIIDPSHESYEALKAQTDDLTKRLDEVMNNPQAADDATPPPAPPHSNREGNKVKPHFSDLERVRPFHWGAEFPEVFYKADGTLKDNPGFTIVFGNPPWEILKPDLREFYAQFDELIESRYNRAQVEKRIAELDAEDPRRRQEFDAINASVAATTTFLRGSGDYKRQGRGDPATHKLFLERMYTLLQRDGRLGYVVPSGIYTDLGTKELREMLLNEGSIQYIYSFSNERFFFPGVDHRFKFCMLGAHKGQQTDGFWAAFRFNPRVAVAPDDLPAFLENASNKIYVKQSSLQRFSPESLGVMEFQNKQDYKVAEKVYADWPLFGEDISQTAWSAKFGIEIHATNNRDTISNNQMGLPLYEGGSIHQYNGFYGKFEFLVDETKGRKKLLGTHQVDSGQILSYQIPRLAYREIARSSDERTLIAAIIPPKVFCNHKLFTIQTGNSAIDLFLLAVLNSFLLDYLTRFRVASSVSMYITKSLPIPRLTAGNPTFDAIVERAARLTCTRPEFADLWQSVMGTPYPLAQEPHPQPLPVVTGRGVRPAVDPAERQQLRDEIDALVAHLYNLTRDEYNHILGTFPLVFPDTPEGHARRAATLASFDAAAL